MIKNIENYGDILAIPFFKMLSYYFIVKKNKTTFEYLLMVFAISGSVADIYFTFKFLSRNPT
jgi:hypothetical protein